MANFKPKKLEQIDSMELLITENFFLILKGRLKQGCQIQKEQNLPRVISKKRSTPYLIKYFRFCLHFPKTGLIDNIYSTFIKGQKLANGKTVLKFAKFGYF